MFVTLLLFLKTVRALRRLPLQTVTTRTTYLSNRTNASCSTWDSMSSVTLNKDSLVLCSCLLRYCLADSNLMGATWFLKSVSFAWLLRLRIYILLRWYHRWIRSWVVKLLNLVRSFYCVVTLCRLNLAHWISLWRACDYATLIHPTDCCIRSTMVILKSVSSHRSYSRFDNVHRWYMNGG